MSNLREHRISFLMAVLQEGFSFFIQGALYKLCL